jgi:hypothetical protein
VQKAVAGQALAVAAKGLPYTHADHASVVPGGDTLDGRPASRYHGGAAERPFGALPRGTW